MPTGYEKCVTCGVSHHAPAACLFVFVPGTEQNSQLTIDIAYCQGPEHLDFISELSLTARAAEPVALLGSRCAATLAPALT